MSGTIRVIYEDNHVLGVVKPAGMLSQGDKTGDITALELARRYIKETRAKPGNVFLGPVHRLDRPVSGVMVFARTSKAASRLSQSFHDHKVEKRYLCVVSGIVTEDEGELTALMERAHMRSRIVAAPSDRSQEAVLGFRVLARSVRGESDTGRGPAGRPATRKDSASMSLLEVTPRTGRHHQIRLQLSAVGHPIRGDLKYGAVTPLPDKSIALHAARLRVPHPVREEIIDLSAPPSLYAPWSEFAAAIGLLFPPARE
jgi:23S rRNA pseudouridine1911/1915/1917 synthase